MTKLFLAEALIVIVSDVMIQRETMTPLDEGYIKGVIMSASHDI